MPLFFVTFLILYSVTSKYNNKGGEIYEGVKYI